MARGPVRGVVAAEPSLSVRLPSARPGRGAAAAGCAWNSPRAPRFLPAVTLLWIGAAACGAAPETAPFEERVVVFMEATPEELEALRATVPEEDFATIADDLMFYRAEAHLFLEREGWPITTLAGRRPLEFVVSGEAKKYDFAALPALDAIVLFEPGKEPRAIAPLDVALAAAYFQGRAASETPADPTPDPVAPVAGVAFDSTWIVQPSGFGPVRVGMSRDEVDAALGGALERPDPSGPAPPADLPAPGTASTGPASTAELPALVPGTEPAGVASTVACEQVTPSGWPAGVSLIFVEGRFVRVDVREGAVATARGARIGSTEDEIRTLHPGNLTEGPHKYTDGKYLTVTPGEPEEAKLRIVFETDGARVERFRAGALPAVEWVEGCG
ncbi:MAG: hypothetical protein WEG36_14575 [Gemmatimonadota bacterium]